nr:MAG TPA: hypothetical protein [Caudoviricetes sp.]
MAQLRSGRRPYSSARWQHVLSVLVALCTVYLFQHRSMVCNPLCGITSQLLYESSSAVLLQSGLVLRQPEPHLHPSASHG